MQDNLHRGDLGFCVKIPEEILSDLGTQFVSDCMKKVARLLSIKQLTTTPYHPMYVQWADREVQQNFEDHTKEIVQRAAKTVASLR